MILIVAIGTAGFEIGRSTAGPSPPGAEAQQVRLKSAYQGCRDKDEDNTLRLADNGDTIVIDTGSEFGSTAGLACVLGALGTPESIKAELSRTTAIMGAQEADHQGFHYSWIYHPDNGVNMVITDGQGS